MAWLSEHNFEVGMLTLGPNMTLLSVAVDNPCRLLQVLSAVAWRVSNSLKVAQKKSEARR